MLTLVARDDLILDTAFEFGAEIPRLFEMCRKYADQPMDRADACLVRMTDLTVRYKVWTVDWEDLTTYRRHGRQAVPYEFPPEEGARFLRTIVSEA